MKDLTYFKDAYERNGGKVELCEKCGLIVDIEWPEPHWCGSCGPSISYGMFCICKERKEIKNGHD